MNTWSNLPNVAHIDWVLASLKTHTQLWFNAGQIYDAGHEAWIQALDLALDQIQDQARDRVWNQVWSQARDQVRDLAWNQERLQARLQAWHAVKGVILALTAYDHTDRYLNMKPDQLNTWAHLSEDPAAILLLPMVWVQQQIKEHHHEHMV